MYEVSSRTVFPYTAVTYIEVGWPNGSATVASGVVVGANDVLTAMHVVFNSARGGWASSVAIYPGADTRPVFDAPLGSFGNGWRISARTTNWDQNGDGLMSDSEAQFDLALIGLYQRIGDTTGWMGSRNEAADGAATMLGYPSRGTGLMAENVYADASSNWGVYDINSGLGAGSSGGPLVRTASDGTVYVVGVASSGNAADTLATYAALFGPGNWEWFAAAVDANDDLIGGGGNNGGGGGGNGGGLLVPLLLTDAYLAYFGRPVDYTGAKYFSTRSEAELVAAFDASRESQDLYGLNLTLKIKAIYHNLFNRDAEASGVEYWSTLIASNRISAPGAALAIFRGALGSDALTAQNKHMVSTAFSYALDTEAELAGYSGLAAAQSARSFVATVGGSAASLQQALGRVDAAVQAAVSLGSPFSTAFAQDGAVPTLGALPLLSSVQAPSANEWAGVELVGVGATVPWYDAQVGAW